MSIGSVVVRALGGGVWPLLVSPLPPLVRAELVGRGVRTPDVSVPAGARDLLRVGDVGGQILKPIVAPSK